MFRIARNAVDINGNTSFLLSHTPKKTGPALEEGPVEVVSEKTPAAAVEPLPDIEAIKQEAQSIERKAQEAVDRANAHARDTVEKARTEAERLRSGAREEGFAEGHAQGLEEGARQAEEALKKHLDGERAAFAAFMQGLAEQRGAMFDSMEHHVLQLSLAIAEKIVRDALDRDDEAFRTLVRSAIEQLKNADRVTVRVSAEDYERFYATGSFAMELNDDPIRISVVEDASLSRGSCLVETADEMIDASIRTQLNIIREAFNQGSPERTKVSL